MLTVRVPCPWLPLEIPLPFEMPLRDPRPLRPLPDFHSLSHCFSPLFRSLLPTSQTTSPAKRVKKHNPAAKAHRYHPESPEWKSLQALRQATDFATLFEHMPFFDCRFAALNINIHRLPPPELFQEALLLSLLTCAKSSIKTSRIKKHFAAVSAGELPLDYGFVIFPEFFLPIVHTLSFDQASMLLSFVMRGHTYYENRKIERYVDLTHYTLQMQKVLLLFPFPSFFSFLPLSRLPL